MGVKLKTDGSVNFSIFSFLSACCIFCVVSYVAHASNSDASSSQTGEAPEPAVQWQTRQMRVTAYCPCEKCCGRHADGITASGHIIKDGDTFVAADGRYSFGTEMLIPGYNNDQPVKVLDRGGAIRGDKIDVFFNSHSQALEWGVRNLQVKIRIN
jgi:3D (Asp-Asp-Asp) domain-containing protein